MAKDQADEVGVNYRIPRDLHRRAKTAASQQGRTFKAWLERAIQAAVEAHERDEEERRKRR
jgi:predicted HicB family RNase H-like nuclease